MAPRIGRLEQDVPGEPLVHVNCQAVVLGITGRQEGNNWKRKPVGQKRVTYGRVTLGDKLRKGYRQCIKRCLARWREEQRQVVSCRYDRITVDLVLEQEMYAPISQIPHFRRVVLRKGPLNADVPVDRVAKLLVSQVSRCCCARGCRRLRWRQGMWRNSTAGKIAGLVVFGCLVDGGCCLRRTNGLADVIKDQIVGKTKPTASRCRRVIPRRLCKSDTRRDVRFLRTRRAERNHAGHIGDTVEIELLHRTRNR